MKKKKVLIVAHHYSTFVMRDVRILEKEYEVVMHKYTGGKDLRSNFLAQIKLLFFFIVNAMRVHAIYVWFADYHTFLPVLFSRLWRKPSFVIEGGYDTVSIPEIKYGSHQKALRSSMSTYSMKHCTLNLPVCETLTPEIKERAPFAQIEHVYTGYDPNMFIAGTGKEKIVLTVADGNTEQRIRLKGVDTFVELARRMPEYKFIVIGMKAKAREILGELPANLELYNLMPIEELIIYYQKAKVYTQFSMREGLPNVVCEAMLCECVPVGFRTGGIPVAIGDAGYTMDFGDIDKAQDAIHRAMGDDGNLGKKARKHVIDKFPLSLREDKLLKLLRETKA